MQWETRRTGSFAPSLKLVTRVVRNGLAALGLIFILVTFTPLVPWYGRKLAGPWNDPRGEVLIVLGGTGSNDGIIGGSSYWRTAYAVQAYREGGFQQIILSGGGSYTTPVAVAMEAFLESQGVPGNVIRVETASRSTRENALYVKPLLAGNGGHRVLMTSDFHMFRARRVFQKLGIEVQPRPIPDVLKRASSRRGRWPAFLDLVLETGRIVDYYVHDWI